MPDEPINYYREAFMEPMNLVFLITALVVAVLTGGLRTGVPAPGTRQSRGRTT